MKALMFVCAQSAVMDRQSNNISVFNVMEEISAPAFPVAIQAFTIAILLRRNDDEPSDPQNMRCKMHLEELELINAPVLANFQGRPGLKVISHVQGMIIPGPGNLLVSLFEGETELASWPILVSNIGRAALETDAAPAANAN